MKGASTLWSGRFDHPADTALRSMNDSFSFDRRLALVDVRGSVAYAGSLREVGLLDSREHEAIVGGLRRIAGEFEEETFVPKPGDEDIHTAVERRLLELVGGVAGKRHTGRSRNDQVATDLRLYVMEAVDGLLAKLRAIQREIVVKAGGHLSVIMPGYTHLQPAQPILFSHWLMSFFWKLERDRRRLVAARRQASVCPLGSGALAGCPFSIDRDRLAASLGFDSVTENSLDAVEDRDFVADVLFVASLLQTHLSSVAETLIIWSSPAYGFVRLSDRHCTGSSLMPQKRNPDALELMRGKTGRLLGHLVGMLTALKGLPSGYNKDLQEDKEGLFDVIDTLAVELPVVSAVIRRMRVNAAHMAEARDGGLLATELADYLVRKGVPFREAHHAVGRVVRHAEKAGLALELVPANAYRRFHQAFGKDTPGVLDVHLAVSRRSGRGGTARESVEQQIARARALLDADTPPPDA